MNINIGENIKKLRKQNEITQEKLAEIFNVSTVAVCKWERGETYPDITLLMPMANYFKVTIDELMGYNKEKTKEDIENIIKTYQSLLRNQEHSKAHDLIVEGYRKYPNDYFIMHYYMWDIAGGIADNTEDVLLKHKNEFLLICDKIQDGCKEESLRLSAWNMRAKILHAEKRTSEALNIYQEKFASFYQTADQKSEQLFSKDTEEYYYWLKKNMFELIDFAADKLGRAVFFDNNLSLDEKNEKALQYGNLIIDVSKQTKEPFFIMIAYAFLGRMENDLIYLKGSDDNIIKIMDLHLYAIQILNEFLKENSMLQKVFEENHPSITDKDILKWYIKYYQKDEKNKRKELLKNPLYINVINKYK